MANVRVELVSVQVTESQGITEGDFELRLHVQEGAHSVVWPSLNGSTRVDNNGPAMTIGREVATYSVPDGGVLDKDFTIDVTEVDKGLNGLDDIGQGVLSLHFTSVMTPLTKSASIALKRPRGEYDGKVSVTLTARIV